jgi:hypothetical protein
LKAKSFFLCISVEAMVVGRVNIMNRAFQVRQLIFPSYKQRLDSTILDLQAIAAADGVTHWLKHRLQFHPRLAEVYKLGEADWLLCQKRTVDFVVVMVSKLNTRIPELTTPVPPNPA